MFVDVEEQNENEASRPIPSLMTLYSEIVCTEKPDVEGSVRRWIKRYEKHAMEEKNGMVPEDIISSPIHELLAFVLLVTTGNVPKSLPYKVISLFENNLKQNENDVDVESLAKEFSEKINVISKYPIRAKKNIRNVVSEFWETLVLACRNEILFEENFLETVVSWLVSCSSATLRALRDTATISAYAIADSLLAIMSELSRKLDVDRRRLSTEQKKSKASSKRVNDLKQSVKTCETNHAIAKESFSSVLHGVLVHRSDDVDDHIRADSIECLGKWSWKNPELVLRKHQSRLARMFQDVSYRVRKGVANALNSIVSRVKDKNHVKIVKSLVTRTRKQIWGLAVDVDDRVVMSGLNLLDTLAKRDMLWKEEDEEEEDERPELKALEIHLLSEKELLQNRAAKFLMSQIRGFKGENVVAKQQIRALVDLAVRHGDEKSGVVSHVDHFVHAFRRVAESALSDCVAMCEMLCMDTRGTKSLSDYQSLILSRILFASYNCFKEDSESNSSRRADNVESYVFFFTRFFLRDYFFFKRTRQTTKSQNRCKAYVKVFSDTLAMKLPDLLERFLADTDVTRQLLEISTLVNVESYANTQHSKMFKKLLAQFRNAFETHSDASVLKTVAAALQHLSSASHGRQSEVVSEISSLAKNLVSRLESNDDDDEEEEDKDDVSKLLCLRRLQFLLCWIDVTQIVTSEDTIHTLENMLQDCASDIKSDISIRIMQELPGVMTLWYYWMSRVDEEEEEEKSTWKQGIVKLAKLLCDTIHNTEPSTDVDVREMLKSVFFALNDIRLRLAGTYISEHKHTEYSTNKTTTYVQVLNF